jgi:MtN3 and saliva related transmembrane protein
MIEIIGYIAAFLTTFAYLPQAIKIFREKSAKNISLITFLMMITGITMWLIYGILISSKPVIFANIVSLSLNAAILILMFIYRKS